MRRNKVDFMGISEVRWEQSDELMSEEFRMFYSCGDAKGNLGVGIVLGPLVRDKVISVRYVELDDGGEVARKKSRLSDSENSHAT